VKAAAVDANAERVIARYFAVREPLRKAKPKLRSLTESILPDERAGDFAQALMDLGSAICTPKRPACASCPWFDDCEARRLGIQETLPVRNEKPERPLKRGAAFVARDKTGAILLTKRPETGLLGGMRQPPQGPWNEKFPSPKEATLHAPFAAEWRKLPGIVRHGFTHFELEIEVYYTEVEKRPKSISTCHPRPSDASASRGEGDPVEFIWTTDLENAALPTVMRKIVFHALDDGGPLFQARSARKR
jgi:A/G-specific adenine glycosylase